MRCETEGCEAEVDQGYLDELRVDGVRHDIIECRACLNGERRRVEEAVRMDEANVNIRRIEEAMVYGDGAAARTWREATAITHAFRTQVLFGLLMNADSGRVRRYIDRMRDAVRAIREVTK